MTSQLKYQCAIAVLGALGVSAVQASSFQILEQSPSKLGTAFSGTGSYIEDATTVFFNPAGMSQIKERQLSLAANAIVVTSEFNNEGSTAAAGTPLEQPLQGVEDETDEVGVVPNLYLVQPLSDRWRLGLGINAPFGLASDYGDDWLGRYHATESELQVINVNATVSYSLTETLAVAAGINYQYADTTLENQVDSFGVCAQSAGANQMPLDSCFQSFGGSGNAATDSSAEIEGDDDDVVVDLSLYWQPLASTSFGVVWREGAEFTLEGDAEFEASSSCAQNPLCAGGLQALSGDVEASAGMPDTLTLSGSHRVSERLAVHADVAWTEWSTLQQIDIVNTDTDQAISELELNYGDTVRYALGATYQANEVWTLRAGFAFDEAPQTDAEFVTPRIPDQDRIWLALGLNYVLSDTASVDLGYVHLFVDDAEIDSTEQGNRLLGDFDASADLFSAQLNWRF